MRSIRSYVLLILANVLRAIRKLVFGRTSPAHRHPDFSTIPDFDDLPPVGSMPQGCAWGLFDRDGKKDALGCLNLLTPTVVRRAYKEARDGHSVSLNWNLNGISSSGFNRKGLVHRVIAFGDLHDPAWTSLHGFDEEVEFNTQCSSQWDSLAHWSHQPSRTYYNGAKPSKKDLMQSFRREDRDGKFPTLQHWHKRGGVVGRGVLLDFKRWADEHKVEFNPLSSDKIYVNDLEKVAAWEGVEIRQGDVIIIRSGYTEALDAAQTAEEQAAMFGGHGTCGVFGSVETARWFWNKHPAAVAGDMIAFEQIPPVRPDGSTGTLEDLVLHPYFLSLFGLHIGELWDLKELSRICAEKERYSFLFTSVPLNVDGSVAGPPNALAIF